MRTSCKLFLFSFLVLFLILPFNGCDITKQTRQSLALARCDFRILSVENVNIAGVMIQNIKSVSDLGIFDMAKIMALFVSPTVPLSLQLNIEGRNPNPELAGLNRLEWILFIDDIQMTSGIFERPFTIPPDNGIAIIPVQIGMDLKQALHGESAEVLLRFCMNLAGIGNVPSRFKIKLKPTIMIAGTPVSYPGYITVKTEYGTNASMTK
ncbi:MAG: hypothetical protein M0Q38_08430 [Bacteroidales bacterium]|jgi:hypothetical protein|nr:hypothetical protein [Bacteroidales bacterium]